MEESHCDSMGLQKSFRNNLGTDTTSGMSAIHSDCQAHTNLRYCGLVNTPEDSDSEEIQRLACVGKTSTMNTSSRAVLEVLLDHVSLLIYVEREERAAVCRLVQSRQWRVINVLGGHIRSSQNLALAYKLS